MQSLSSDGCYNFQKKCSDGRCIPSYASCADECKLNKIGKFTLCLMITYRSFPLNLLQIQTEWK